jgi:hypothetical protein
VDVTDPIEPASSASPASSSASPATPSADPTAPSADATTRRTRSRRRVIGWTVAAVALVLIGAVAWVGVRGLLAKNELEAAAPLADSIVSSIGDGDTAGARDTADDLVRHTGAAAQYTGDPVWRAFEILPWIGDDLRAVREVAGSVDGLATDAVAPLLTLVETFGVEQFAPVDGTLPVQPLIDAQPTVAAAAAATATAHDRVDAIDTSGTVGPVTEAVTRLSGLVASADAATDAADRAVRLLPLFLGGDRPREYLLLFQNPAEARSSGGIPSALALVRTDGGSIELVQQASSGDFRGNNDPVMDLPTETEGIYGDITAKYIQNVTLTPHFPLTGELAKGMWERRFGGSIDGVVAVDPIALSYLLRATGPITLPTGDELTADNAVDLLLRDVYLRYADPTEQDVFFAGTAAAVFSEISQGRFDPAAFVAALADAGDERRILVWSAAAEEQDILADTTLAGDLTRVGESDRYGVYLNDATGSKMASFLDIRIGSGSVACREDGRPFQDLEITITNTAPADAGTSLPWYVTGGGQFGITPGHARYIVAFYGAAGSQFVSIDRGGEDVTSRSAVDFGLPVVLSTIELAPGETISLHARFLAPEDGSTSPEVELTPGVHQPEITGLDLECVIP